MRVTRCVYIDRGSREGTIFPPVVQQEIKLLTEEEFGLALVDADVILAAACTFRGQFGAVGAYRSREEYPEMRTR